MEIQPKFHHGRNLKRFREMLGVKQDALAFDLGDDWLQNKESKGKVALLEKMLATAGGK